MALVAGVNGNCFSLLLKASSKKQILEILRDAYATINDQHQVEVVNKKTTMTLAVNNREASELISSLSNFIKMILYETLSTSDEISAVIPNEVHANLKELLVKILVECVPEWQADTVNNLVSIPKLIDFNWRVDVKMASDDDKQSSSPSCILQLKVEDDKKSIGTDFETKIVNVELSKETLDTMLHGLGRIRDQLSTVANK